MDAVDSPDFGCWINIRHCADRVAAESIPAAFFFTGVLLLTIAPDDKLQIKISNYSRGYSLIFLSGNDIYSTFTLLKMASHTNDQTSRRNASITTLSGSSTISE